MKLQDLRPARGSVKKDKRVGRGGPHAKTSCRGHKGQKARSGGGKGPVFEGGQTPWYRRLPKYRGFKNMNKVEYHEVSLKDLSVFKKDELVTPELLHENKVIKNLNLPVKVLANGEIKVPLTVRLHKFTKGAKELIEKAGGKTEVIK